MADDDAPRPPRHWHETPVGILWTDKLDRLEDEIDKPGGLREIKHHYANLANTSSLRLTNLDGPRGRVEALEKRLERIEEADRAARNKLAAVAAGAATLGVQLVEWLIR